MEGLKDDLYITARLLDLIGRRVCVPRYRLAPEYLFPAARDNAMAKYHALEAEGDLPEATESISEISTFLLRHLTPT